MRISGMCAWFILILTTPLLSQDPTADTPSTAAAPNTDIVEYQGLSEKVDAWNAPLTAQLQGEIKQLDGQRLAMIETDGSARTIPSEQIIRVTPQWRTALALQAHAQFIERKPKEVLKSVPEALKSGLVQWQQRLLIAELVQSVDALGNPRAAGINFLSLANSDAPHFLYADMPLCWSLCEPDASMREQAQKWLLDESEAARLLGASWLLFEDQAVEAKQQLTRLQRSQNSAIAQFAVTQGWRLTPPPQTMSNLVGWLEQRDKLIPPLQLGPTEFIADRLMRIGQTDLAIGQWLRVASQHDDRPHRAARALLSAAAQLKRLGRDEEEQRLEAWIQRLAPTK